MMQLNTTSEVIDALGGTLAVSERLDVSMQNVTNWRAMPKFPAHTYVAIKAALKEIDRHAPDSLWRMIGVDVPGDGAVSVAESR